MLKFNVMWYNMSTREFEAYNIIWDSLLEDLEKLRRKGEIKTLADLRQRLKTTYFSHFFGRAEYEMLVGDLWMKDISECKKIDIYQQIDMKLDLITKLVAEELNTGKKKKIR